MQQSQSGLDLNVEWLRTHIYPRSESVLCCADREHPDMPKPTSSKIDWILFSSLQPQNHFDSIVRRSQSIFPYDLVFAQGGPVASQGNYGKY